MFTNTEALSGFTVDDLAVLHEGWPARGQPKPSPRRRLPSGAAAARAARRPR